ncbi:FAD-binding oxidoreductase [Maricurvus nonylphenolicus]|uniref:FAD-binding oxidoreductase n=1 Tax=Maricurvus nonylphenolicus TaxID=1008307 RepID=UPI0036F3921E
MSQAQSNDYILELQQLFGTEAVIHGNELQERAVSYWNAAPTEAMALVKPATTEQVSELLRWSYKHQISVVTQGGLTGCVEGCVAADDEIILSLERMNHIEVIDPIGGTAQVQAGVILETLQQAVADQQLRFPLDLGARGSCTLGGNAATNAGGINVLRYGMMRNLVLGLEAVLPDGTVVSSMNQMLKNNSGYDLKQLFIGTEGTLGVITRLVVRLFPQPLSCNSALVALDSFEQVTQLLNHLQRDLAGALSAFEVMWGDYIQRVTQPGWHKSPMSSDYSFYVMLEAEGADPDTDGARFSTLLEQSLEDGIIVDAVLPKSELERRQLWDIRENFEALYQQPPTFLYDISLPIKDMAAYVAQVKERLQERWPESECSVLGHMADGNLHLFISPLCEGERSHLHHQADEDVYEPLRQFEGAVSAEHGIGLEKKAWLGHSRSRAEVELMRALKKTLDPLSLLNPGRVFDL